MNICLFNIRRCFGFSLDSNVNLITENQISHSVMLSTLKMGNEVVIVKNGKRICGNGLALANTAIQQNKAYFEVKLQQEGVWGVGLCTKNINLNRIPPSSDEKEEIFCYLTHEGDIYLNGRKVHQSKVLMNESSVIGIAYDHVELRFYVNNKPIDYSISGLKGEFYPLLYVQNGAILDAEFSQFTYVPPAGFDRILIEKSLL